MNLTGVRPRLKDTSAQDAQDLNMVPNGGTWIDGNGVNSSGGIFTGTQVRNISIRDMGFYNMEDALVFGAPDEDGIGFSEFRNIFCAGITPANGSGTDSCIWLTNMQHVRLDHVNAFECDECFRFTQEHADIQYGNSVITDLYAYVYQAGGANTYGIWWECNYGGAGNGNLINYFSVLRPQINAFGTLGDNIFMDGESNCKINSFTLIGTDTEGAGATFLKMRNVVNSSIEMAGSSPSHTQGPNLDIDATCTQNYLRAVGRQSIVDPFPVNGTNEFHGNWEGHGYTLFGTNELWGFIMDLDAGSKTQLGVNRIESRPQFTDRTADLTTWEQSSIYSSGESTEGNRPNLFGTSTTMNVITGNTSPNYSNLRGHTALLSLSDSGSATNVKFNEAFVIEANATLNENATDTITVDKLRFFNAKHRGWTGSDQTTINWLDFFRVDALGSGANASYLNVNGFYISDLEGRGSTTNRAIYVASQSGADADKGNIEMAGGAWNTGHLVVGTVHIWQNGTDLRMSVGEPTGATDGAIIGSDP